MSAALRTPAHGRYLHPLSDRLGEYSTPAFTAINTRSLPPLSHSLTGLECSKVWERVRREPSFRPIGDSIGDSIGSATPAGAGFNEALFERNRAHSNRTGDLDSSCEKRAVLAKPLATTPTADEEPILEPRDRRFAAKETSHLERRVNADVQNQERDERRKSDILDLLYTNVPLAQDKDALKERNRSSSDDPRADSRCDQIKVRKRQQLWRRTKTGCGTCRRRKKKCDEAKPKCKNCVRGNFECAAYTKQIWLSSVQTSSELPQQQLVSSTEGPTHFSEPLNCNIISNPQCEPSQRIDVTRSKGITVPQDTLVCLGEHVRSVPEMSVWPHTNLEPRQQVHRPLAPLSSQCPAVERYIQQSASQSLCRLPSANEVCPKDDHDTTRFMLQTSPVLAAQPPSSLLPYTQPLLCPKSEKVKMLSGEPFLQDTAQLVEERSLSSQASFYFNAAVQKDSGERAWLFERIIAARWVCPRAGACQPTSRLGHEVNVTAPFYCDYGYNISIGDNAVIGPGCQLLDSGKIEIGGNTKIGACVTISTLEEPNDARTLGKSKRTVIAREVFIGENVYIGDGCVIGGGARIGDNAIVRAGSVVVQVIPADYVVSGS